MLKETDLVLLSLRSKPEGFETSDLQRTGMAGTIVASVGLLGIYVPSNLVRVIRVPYTPICVWEGRATGRYLASTGQSGIWQE